MMPVSTVVLTRWPAPLCRKLSKRAPAGGVDDTVYPRCPSTVSMKILAAVLAAEDCHG